MQKKFVGILIPLITIVVIAVIAGLWTIPTIQKYQSVTTDTDLAQRELDQTLIPKRDALASVNVEDVQTVLDELDTILPESIDPGLVLGILEELTARHNLRLTNQTFLRRNSEEQTLEFNFNVLGSTEDAKRFLAELENIKPIIYVKQLTLTTTIDDEGTNLAKTSVMISSPYGTKVIEDDDSLAQTVTDNDKQVVESLKERFNYFASALYYKVSDPFARGKNDPFNETGTE